MPDILLVTGALLVGACACALLAVLIMRLRRKARKHKPQPEPLPPTQADNLDDLAAKIEWVYAHPAEAGAFTRRGRRVYGRHLWTKEKWKFIGLVEGLVEHEALG